MARPGWRGRVVRWFRTILLGYGVLLGVVFFAQRGLLYHPEVAPEAALLAQASQWGAEPWRNPAGDLIGWRRPARGVTGPHRQVLLLHGNAGDALDRVNYAAGLTAVSPFALHVLEYPGFGARPGSPSQTALLAAAEDAFQLLRREGPVYLIGESLGTGVAAWLAGRFPDAVPAVLLVTPYHDLVEVGQYQMPIFPVGLMLWDRYPAAKFLRPYHGPLAVVLAGDDRVVPARFGRELFEAYAGPKRVWEIPGAGHNDVMLRLPAGWWGELADFWQWAPAPGTPSAPPTTGSAGLSPPPAPGR